MSWDGAAGERHRAFRTEIKRTLVPGCRPVLEQVTDHLQPGLGSGGLVVREREFGDDPGGYDPGPTCLMVEANNPVVHADGNVRRTELVGLGLGLPVERAAESVPEEAGPPAEERRQLGPGRAGDLPTIEAVVPEY